MESKRFNLRPNPEGYRKVSVEADFFGKPVKAEGIVPGDSLYPEEVKRLSKKVTRNERYSEPFWDDSLATMTRFRDRSFMRGPFAFTIREIHDATKSPVESLLQIQVITQLPASTLGDEVVHPTQYMSYSPDTHTLQLFRFDTLGPDIQQQDLQAAADLAALTGEDQGGDKELLFFYTTLLEVAGEKMRSA